jgi:hypothetical protein
MLILIEGKITTWAQTEGQDMSRYHLLAGFLPIKGQLEHLNKSRLEILKPPTRFTNKYCNSSKVFNQ